MAQEIYHRSNWGNPTETWGNSYLNADLTNELYKRASEYENSWVTDQLLNGVGTKPSIILTPTAYEDGILNSVKPKGGENLLLYSEDFSQSDWTKTDVLIESGYTAPDGTNNAYKVTNNGSNSLLATSVGLTANKHKSIWARTVSGTGTVQLLNHNSASNNIFTITTQWQRFDATNSGDFDNFYAVDFRGASTTLSEVVLWGAQLERGSQATAYIPTNGTAYKNGDFDFTRGSSATRVNEKGLVEKITDDTDLPRINYTNFDYEDVLGDELTSPLDFTSDWTSTGATSITENSFQTSGSGIGIYFSLEADKKYKIKVSNVSGDISIRYRTSNGGAGTVAGNFDEFIIINTFGSTTPNIYLRANSETTVTVGDVTIKELTEDVVVPYSGEGSLLLENQSTNLITYSEDFSQWTATGNTTISATNIASPSGENNATNITGLNGSGSNDLRFFPSGFNSANKTLSFSLYLKGSGTLSLQMSNGVNQAVRETITLTSNWKRHILTTTFNSTTSSGFHVNIDDYNSATATSYNIWGAQLEQLSYATSYIPTEGSTVTRLADVCNNSGNSDLINSTEGVLYFEGSALANDGTNRWAVALSDGTNNERVQIIYLSDNSIASSVISSNSSQCSFNYSGGLATDFNKIAILYKDNDFKMYVNGTQVDSDTSGNAPSGLNTLGFERPTGVSQFYGNVKCVAVFKEALSDTELQKLTTI